MRRLHCCAPKVLKKCCTFSEHSLDRDHALDLDLQEFQMSLARITRTITSRSRKPTARYRSAPKGQPDSSPGQSESDERRPGGWSQSNVGALKGPRETERQHGRTKTAREGPRRPTSNHPSHRTDLTDALPPDGTVHRFHRFAQILRLASHL